ncbi:MAG: two pore domain potassium channel family protein [Deltaproteobacteria bacterium]|nr:two pore domain potassium channel family protein [Deltaproteobacteria bacterium]MBI3391387.1 two pore domain potassium channel family protein [Deltaproteobacteria bacterium]
MLRRFWSTDRSLTVLLVLLGIFVFTIDPLGDLGVTGQSLMSVFFSLVLISGVRAVAKSPLPTVLVGSLVLTNLVARWLRLWLGGGSLAAADAFFSSLFCGIMAAVVLAQVFRAGPITSNRIQGAVAVYLLLGLAWAFAYELIALRWPDAFVPPPVASTTSNGDLTSHFVYFSFVTLTTVGYGDIVAAHPVARSLVMLEALFGQLFPAILLARLVSMELYDRRTKEQVQR